MERILVLRGGALGDFILTLPALALLRERWPSARIELAGNATAGQLAVARGLIDRVHSQHEARWAELYGDGPLSPEFSAWLASFDLVVSYSPDPDGELQRRFPTRTQKQFLSASAMPTRAPAAAHYCEPLRQLGLVPRGYLFRLSPLSPASLNVTAASPSGGPLLPPAQPSTYIAIHPGSGSPRKNWPEENWCRLIERLPAPVSLILGEAEREHSKTQAALAATAAEATSHPGGQRECHTFINRPLEDLVDHLSQCRLFLGHDSGISHLAAACGVRCVLLFGPTDPDVWAPPAPHVHVIRCDSTLAQLPVETVERAVLEALQDRR